MVTFFTWWNLTYINDFNPLLATNHRLHRVVHVTHEADFGFHASSQSSRERNNKFP